MGDLIADAEPSATSAPDRGGAVIAFMNAGGIRAGLAGKRDVTYGDLYAAQPFSNKLVVVSITGDILRRILEQQFTGESSSELLQVSNGFTYTYRAHAPIGQHIEEGLHAPERQAHRAHGHTSRHRQRLCHQRQ